MNNEESPSPQLNPQTFTVQLLPHQSWVGGTIVDNYHPPFGVSPSRIYSIFGHPVEDFPTQDEPPFQLRLPWQTGTVTSRPGQTTRSDSEFVGQMSSKALTFNGTPSRLDEYIAHCTTTALAAGRTTEQERSAILSQGFRGPALSWFTAQLAANGELLNNYAEFEQAVKAEFGLDPAAKAAIAAKKLARCTQRTSVQDYATRFRLLASECNLPQATAIAYFLKGLKAQVTNALIINSETATLEEAITEAVRYDAQSFASNSARRGGNSNRGSFNSYRKRYSGKRAKSEPDY